jgi:capsular exopolysaccharide synthesis family protein
MAMRAGLPVPVNSHPPLPAAARPASAAAPPRELLAVLARRWRVVALTVAVAVGATAAYCLVAERRYRAQATILIDARSPQLLASQRVGEEQDALTSAKYDYYQTQFELLRSPLLAARVIEELGLAHDARFVPPGYVARGPAATPDPGLVQAYTRALHVVPLRGTRLVSVQFESRDPELAAAVANTHARLFVRRGLERLDQALEQMRGFLETKLAGLRERMHAAEMRLLAYQSAHQLLPADLTRGVADERFGDLSRRLTAAEAEAIALEAQYRLVQERKPDALPAVVANPLIQKLREEMNRLEVEYALMAKRFRTAYPPLRQLAGQVEGARRLLDEQIGKVAAGVEASYLAARRTVRDLRKSLAAERRALLRGKDTEGELLRLTHDAQTTRALHDNVLARVKELDVAGGADTSNISVAEAAATPAWPSAPATRFNLLLSLATGLVFGTGLAFLRESWTRMVRDPDDVERATGLETLAVIPNFDDPPAGSAPERLRWHAARARAAAASGLRLLRPGPPTSSPPARYLPGTVGMSPAAEAYQTLRTSLLLSPAGGTPRVVVVTSAVAREGKTTTAVNTALALASCGATVLLVDGDLRLPRCHELLDVALSPGLSDYLSGGVSAQPIHATAHPNLSFVPAGRPAAHPTELLTSWRMTALLQAARQGFDFVVIDSPPVLAVSDGLLLAHAADGVLLVAESQRSSWERVQLAVQRLHQARVAVLGAVLNRGAVERDYYRYGYGARRGSNGTAPAGDGAAVSGLA